MLSLGFLFGDYEFLCGAVDSVFVCGGSVEELEECG